MSSIYLVTGGCGFIGSHLCEAILARGGRVRVLDDLSSGHLQNIEPFRDRVELVIGSVCEEGVVSAAMAGVTYVFQEAALVSVFDSVARPRDNHDINMTGTLNVLTAAKQAGVKRVVMASSAAVYGNDPEIPKRETMTPRPESPYAIGKITGEYYLRIFHSLYGLETVALRYFNVYGPRQDPKSVYSGVISRFFRDIKQGVAPTVYGDGGQSRDFVFVDDVVQANMLAMHNQHTGCGEVFNVATGRSVTLMELLHEMGEVLGCRVQPEFQPARAGDIRASAASIELIQSSLGYQPRSDLRSGLASLLASEQGQPVVRS
jgi:UDP-glucose 4-epimerase